MNDVEYNKRIDEKDVLDHTTLNITLKEVVAAQEFELATGIQRILKDNQIPKPEQHQKPYDTSVSYYNVDLSSEQIDRIIDLFFDLEAQYVDDSGETTPTAGFYARLVDKWNVLAA